MRRLQTGRLASLIARWIASTLFALLGAAASAGTTESFTFPQEPYEGSQQRRVKVYVPGGLSGPAPMVMALHGCRQTHDDVLRDWGLTAAADRFGFILVAPFITSYDGLRTTNCWGFWFDGHRHQGRGEPEDLHRIALEVERRYAIDPRATLHHRAVVGRCDERGRGGRAQRILGRGGERVRPAVRRRLGVGVVARAAPASRSSTRSTGVVARHACASATTPMRSR